MEKANRIIPAVCGVLGLVAGCLAAYFILSTLWTRIVVRSAEVNAHDLYIVLTLSIIAGVMSGFLALQVSARRYRNPQNRTQHRHVS